MGPAKPAAAAAFVGALGVVFGDIGTSPLYTIPTVFSPNDPHPVQASLDNIYGVVSLIFWSVTVLVTCKYVLLVMRADNDGEGGIMALISLIRGLNVRRRRTVLALSALGIFGASLFFGDSMITPAISVLSAVEGLKVVEPSLHDIVIPVTVVIIVALFVVQRRGTSVVGRFFGPVMVVWFATIAALGIHGIAGHPEVLKGLSPSYAASFVVNDTATAFFSLAAVVLAVTGAEALYADMGHFGRPAITRAWLVLVFPACILNYLGQGALLIGGADVTAGAPFFQLVPHWGQIPMVVLATVATVIASQAVISGAFSVAHQAVQLGYLPRLRIRHTSDSEIGQVYVPLVNWLLMVSVLALIFAFRSSTRLAFAYGTAVTGTFIITTILFFYLARNRGRKPMWMVAGGAAFFLFFDLSFFSANLTKFGHGGWLPLLIGVAAYTVMSTWARGRALVTAERRREEGPLEDFVTSIRELDPPLIRVPGTAVFLNRGRTTAPLAMRETVEHHHSLHEHVVILWVETIPVPRVADDERILVDDLGYSDDGISFVTARFGYAEEPDVPAVLSRANEAGLECPLEVDQASYFLSRIELRRTDAPGMAAWRKGLFEVTAESSADAADYFHLPRHRTVLMGSQIEF